MNKKIWIPIIILFIVLAGCVSTCAVAVGKNTDKSGSPGSSHDPKKDVTISNCKISEEFAGSYKLSVDTKVVNNSSKPSNYLVTITFENPDGDQLGTGTVAVAHLNSGQKAEQTALTLFQSSVAPKGLGCKVAEVTRYAS